MLSKLRNRQKGFTLIELLIVVAIIGIIAAILIPNFIDALHKGRSKRTMGDMRQLGLGLGQYWTDNSGAAAAGANTVTTNLWSGTDHLAELQAVLVPDYIATVPAKDGWGHALTINVDLVEPPRAGYALFFSPGRDSNTLGGTYTAGAFHPTDYVQDILWCDGSFVRAPAGSQGS